VGLGERDGDALALRDTAPPTLCDRDGEAERDAAPLRLADRDEEAERDAELVGDSDPGLDADADADGGGIHMQHEHMLHEVHAQSLSSVALFEAAQNSSPPKLFGSFVPHTPAVCMLRKKDVLTPDSHAQNW
jgi:hypothetical protein